jgi:hypothetical protein
MYISKIPPNVIKAYVETIFGKVYNNELDSAKSYYIMTNELIKRCILYADEKAILTPEYFFTTLYTVVKLPRGPCDMKGVLVYSNQGPFDSSRGLSIPLIKESDKLGFTRSGRRIPLISVNDANYILNHENPLEIIQLYKTKYPKDLMCLC